MSEILRTKKQNFGRTEKERLVRESQTGLKIRRFNLENKNKINSHNPRFMNKLHYSTERKFVKGFFCLFCYCVIFSL